MGTTKIYLNRGNTLKYTSPYIRTTSGNLNSSSINLSGLSFSNLNKVEPWFNKTSKQLWVDDVCINPNIKFNNPIAYFNYSTDNDVVNYTVGLRLSSVVGNILSIKSDGLYASNNIEYYPGPYIKIIDYKIEHKFPTEAINDNDTNIIEPQEIVTPFDWNTDNFIIVPKIEVDTYGHIYTYSQEKITLSIPEAASACRLDGDSISHTTNIEIASLPAMKITLNEYTDTESTVVLQHVNQDSNGVGSMVKFEKDGSTTHDCIGMHITIIDGGVVTPPTN